MHVGLGNLVLEVVVVASKSVVVGYVTTYNIDLPLLNRSHLSLTNEV